MNISRGAIPLLCDADFLVLVLAPGWASSEGCLQCFDRQHGFAPWRVAGRPVAVSLGRSGLAPACGAAADGVSQMPPKREGDGCSPAGVFPVTALFGYAGPDSMPARLARLPYLHATPDLKCVDDPASRYYNRVVDPARVDRVDWVSCEDMRRADCRYEIGAVVGCNGDPVVAGAGSCVFLHVWEAPGAPTAGCTAMALADMSEVARRLAGAMSPVLVQLPRAEYARWRAAWALPEIAG